MLELLLEILVQGFLEALMTSGLELLSGAAGVSSDTGKAGTVLGLSVVGGVLGIGSTWVVPPLVPQPSAGVQLAVLLVGPMVAGVGAMALGAWHRRRRDELGPLDFFGYAFLCAFAFGVARWVVFTVTG